jgi:hypothetical protein
LLFRRRGEAAGAGRSGAAIGSAWSISVTNVLVPWSSNWIVVRVSLLRVVTPIPKRSWLSHCPSAGCFNAPPPHRRRLARPVIEPPETASGRPSVASIADAR